jgi:hypothetical protein
LGHGTLVFVKILRLMHSSGLPGSGALLSRNPGLGFASKTPYSLLEKLMRWFAGFDS